MEPGPPSVPLIDIKPLLTGDENSSASAAVAAQIGHACREFGFFYLVGHGVDEGLQQRLVTQCQRFFALPEARKLAIHMSRGGRAWRGFFPVGEELTSGKPDRKEGIYFGEELADSHPRVRAGTPLHGRNLFPAELPELADCVLAYQRALTQLGHRLLVGIALSLGLAGDYFAARYTTDPLTLFRVFHYPPEPAAGESGWGVGEHTDYGLLTILKQDDVGGLQIKTGSRYLAAPPIPGSFVCNIGDMLDKMTGGLYRSTPHRVKNVSGKSRLSFPFFFDPNWEARVGPIALPAASAALRAEQDERWDHASVHAFAGTYGDYVLAKVGKVFPGLQKDVL
jgi:isopenicillin N synthase-like dioxygenase